MPVIWIVAADPVQNNTPDLAMKKKLYKSMGIIEMPGIAPPVDIELNDLNGNKIKVSDYTGKIVFLNFWTTWCPDCIREMPSMQKLHNRFKDREFIIIGIDLQESEKQVSAFFKKHKLTFMTLLDKKGKTGIRFGIRAIPTTFILGKNGGLIGKAMGSRDWNSDDAANLFEFLINSE